MKYSLLSFLLALLLQSCATNSDYIEPSGGTHIVTVYNDDGSVRREVTVQALLIDGINEAVVWTDPDTGRRVTHKGSFKVEEQMP